MITLSATFTAAAKDFGAALSKAFSTHGKYRQQACVLVAIGFLSKMTKTQINESARKITGVTDEVWNHGKSEFSKAWRSLDDSPGKYGAGEILATMWANKDFTVTLDKAYELSGGPRKEVDKVESLAKQLATLNADDVQAIIRRYVEISEVQAYARQDIQALVVAGIEEAIRNAPVVAKVA